MSSPKPASHPAAKAAANSAPNTAAHTTPPETPVRVRFAPSPTGYLHVGSIRSGLFNWLWARHNHGTYVLRIEDTDRARLVPGALEQILATHDALGITPNESPRHGGNYGPYLQSERLNIYREHADTLLETGALYRCWCSPERLTKLREEAQKAGVAFKYDRYCLSPANQKSPNEPHVLRFRVPEHWDNPNGHNTAVNWNDAVRGEMRFLLSDLDDFVALKADGYPTYHFANVVDDHLMAITHVLRADEWIPSTPKHLLLFAAFGWEPPIYAHLPAVLGPTGTKKLSKRDGAQSVQEYIDEGYLPEALRSFLATLGWNDGTTQEVYTTPELIERFTLGRVQKSPAKFDRDRLTWINGLMIRRLWHDNPGELLARVEPFWPATAHEAPAEYKRAVLALVQDRLKTLSELPGLTDFFFADPTPTLGELTFNGRIKAASAHKALTSTIEELGRLAQFTPTNLEQYAKDTLFPNIIAPIDPNSFNKRGPYFMMLRVTLTGQTATPGLFETMAVLGRDVTLRRLKASEAQLSR
jgi:glutamyl-tRNA synthetase